MFGHISHVHVIYLHPPIFYQLICFCCISQQGSITINKKHETTLIPVKQIHWKCVCVYVRVCVRERRERERKREREREREREEFDDSSQTNSIHNQLAIDDIGGRASNDQTIFCSSRHFLFFCSILFLLNFIRCSATYFRVFFVSLKNVLNWKK